MNNKKGFTLIELLVVIAIISLLASIIFTTVQGVMKKARDAQRISDLEQIRLALELFYLDKGYYPQSDCGWDCNGYRMSAYGSWSSLATDLEPYMKTLPSDPINSSCAPWNADCYSYAYGNVGRTVYKDQYDLTAQLEDPKNPQRCELKNWKFYFWDAPWCPSYSNQIYEASR